MTLPNGIVVEGTYEELSPLLRYQANGNGSATAVPVSGLWSKALMREFVQSLDPENKGGKQLKLLRFTLAHKRRCTWEQALEVCDAKGKENEGLIVAGVRANITRHARSITKDPKAKVLTWSRADQIYYIPDAIADLLQEVIQEPLAA